VVKLFKSLLCSELRLCHIIENLVIDILGEKYPPNTSNNLYVYYIPEKGRFKDLSLLIDEIKTRKQDFVPDVRTIEEIMELIEPLRETANSNAHSISTYSDQDQIIKLKIPKLIAKLVYLKNRV